MGCGASNASQTADAADLVNPRQPTNPAGSTIKQPGRHVVSSPQEEQKQKTFVTKPQNWRTGRIKATKANFELKEEEKEQIEAPYDKSVAELAQLHKILAKHKILKSVHPAQREQVFHQMGMLTVPEGTEIITRGTCSSKLYVIQSGSAEKLGADGTVKKKLRKGSTFCDRALVMRTPCPVTIRATRECHIWTISRKSYQQVMVDSFADTHKKMHDFLARVKILEPLTAEQRVKVALALVPVSYEDGDFVIRQGEAGDALYIIEEGEVAIRVNKRVKTAGGSGEGGAAAGSNSGTFSTEVGRETAGSYFGEGALLTEEPRSADAVAVGRVKCFRLTAADFQELLGPLRELMDYNFARRVLRRCDVFKSLTDAQMDAVYESLDLATFADGSYIVTQGEVGDMFYIIKEGQVRVCVDEQGGKQREVAEMFASDYFGESALLNDEPRGAHIIAVGDASCLTLNKAKFNAVVASVVGDALEGVASMRALNSGGDAQAAVAAAAAIKFSDLQRLRTIGFGACGSVSLVRHPVTGNTYALKRLRIAEVIAQQQEDAVAQERSVLALLNNPFIVNLVNTFRDDDSVYMLMEIALGGELFTLLNKLVGEAEEADEDAEPRGLPPDLVRFYLAILTSALGYVHSRGVIHRDLKPENLLLTREGYLKIIDFGFAKVVNDGRTFTLCGTPEYIAPEAYARVGHGKAVDWWSLGVLLYDIASSYSLFHVDDSTDPYDCYNRITQYTECYPDIAFPDCITPELGDLLLKLLHPNPAKRYGSTRRRGVREIKEHAYFAGFDWAALEAVKMAPPYVPPIDSIMDTSNFDENFDDPHDAAPPPPEGSDMGWADEF